jgi:predicted N-formylglutamate amidohydrolase
MASVTRPVDGDANRSLLGADDPPPVLFINPDGASPFLLIGDHAGNAVPQRLGSLGIDAVERERHIAWDIGVAALGEALSTALDAVFIRQIYSRLVVDCNRGPDAVDAIAETSDATTIQGNMRIGAAARAARFAEIHEPYHAAIDAELARCDANGTSTIVVALHSFTPVYGTAPPRPWEIGILHDRGDPSFAHACLAVLRRRGDLTVGDNEPYRMDGIDYTVPRHCYPARRRYVEIEVRQDLLAAAGGVAMWSAILARTLTAAAAASERPEIR